MISYKVGHTNSFSNIPLMKRVRSIIWDPLESEDFIKTPTSLDRSRPSVLQLDLEDLKILLVEQLSTAELATSLSLTLDVILEKVGSCFQPVILSGTETAPRMSCSTGISKDLMTRSTGQCLIEDFI